MRTYPECYHCILGQAVSALEIARVDQAVQIQTIKKVLQTLIDLEDTLSPSAIAGETNRVIRESIGVEDIYKKAKEESHQLAISYLDDLRALANQGNDSLEQALKIGAAGNIIDVIHADDYDLWHEVISTVSRDLLGGGIDAFRAKIQKSPHLLYLGDNVGETIFDRVLIENLDIPVIYAVKGGPIFNDATLDEALAAGIDQVAEVVETGAQSPGTILEQCSEDFQSLFHASPVILAKGQANFETLDDQGKKVFFLLRVKCPVLGTELDAPLGSLVLKQGSVVK